MNNDCLIAINAIPQLSFDSSQYEECDNIQPPLIMFPNTYRVFIDSIIIFKYFSYLYCNR